MASKNYKINIAGKTYDVEVGDISKSPVQVSVDGTLYQVEICLLYTSPSPRD